MHVVLSHGILTVWPSNLFDGKMNINGNMIHTVDKFAILRAKWRKNNILYEYQQNWLWDK